MVTGRPVPADGDLAGAAMGGDGSSMGLLLERHRAGMRAVAVALLGYCPEADDAVQEAMLVAIRRLHDLRDRDAVGAWLRAIVRNICRMQRRRARPTVPLDRDDIDAVTATAEQLLEQHALRDWVWHAIEQLSEPLQLVVLLRHFGVPHDYTEIGQICGIPIGTVRSRLSEARKQLNDRLMTDTDGVYEDIGAITSGRARRLRELLRAPFDGGLAATIIDLAEPDMVLSSWWGAVGPEGAVLTREGAFLAERSDGEPDGRELLARILSMDAEAGVREQVVDVTASLRLSIMECELINPPWDPTHCPPAVLWLITMRGERISGVRLYHPEPVRW
jgi:RNA polymerase sigma factor (sigma-70 family)